jgi:hypothetical protein
MRIILGNAAGTEGVVIHDGGQFCGPIPPQDGPSRAIYDRLIAAGVQREPFVEPAPPPARTYKADVWRRATDAEADVIIAALAQQTRRQQRIFNDAQYLDQSDPMFATLKAQFVGAFGQARADQLLAPSA